MAKETDNGADAVRAYARYLKLERNYSGNTREAYVRDVGKLAGYLAAEGRPLAGATAADIHSFMATLHDVGIGLSSQCRVLSSLRSFFGFLVTDGYRADDPTEGVDAPRPGEHLPEVLSPAEVDSLEDSLDPEKPECQRNRAIIEVLFSCGLRVSELVGLKLSDLFLGEGYVRVVGKGSKERLVPISGRAIEELQRAGFWACAATEHAEQDVWHAPLGGRLALVMGSEGEGISRLVAEKCDFSCRLPQRGRVEALNVAQATTVLCYEWLRRVECGEGPDA